MGKSHGKLWKSFGKVEQWGAFLFDAREGEGLKMILKNYLLAIKLCQALVRPKEEAARFQTFWTILICKILFGRRLQNNGLGERKE